MTIREEYDKELHLKFIETLLHLEQAPVFVNNLIGDVTDNKACAVDTLHYLYEELVKARNEINELKKGK